MTRRAISLVVLLAVFLGFSALWALRIPVPVGPDTRWHHFNPDESNHVNVIRYMATHRELPPYILNYVTSGHPPLYHALGAVVYAAAAPLAGPAGAVLLLRLISCALGAGTVWLIYRAARHLVPHRTALLAAGCAAGVPMFVSLSGAVNNENLSALAAAGALAVVVAGLRRGFDTRRVWALAAWTAIGVASKVTCLGLIPSAFAALWWAGKRRGTPNGAILRQMLAVLGASVLLGGWWFVRNQVVYGDPLRAQAHYRLQGERHLGYAGFAERYGVTARNYALLIAREGWTTFWGRFDAMRFGLHERVYLALGCVQLAGFAGFLLLWRRGKLRGYRAAAAGVMALFAAYVLIVFYRFNWQHLTPQGRYFFPLLLPFGLVTAAGWRALFPPRLRNVLSAVLLAVLLLLNLHTLLVMSTSPAPLS